MSYIKNSLRYYTHFKKSPVVGLNITAHGYCDALTNGYGSRNGTVDPVEFSETKFLPHASQTSGNLKVNILGAQCW